MWIPRQKLDWLGITWDSARGTIEIVDRRVAKITCTIDSIMDSDFVLSARRLASFTGQIISTAPVSGNISRIMTRHCIMSTLSAQHWDAKVKMDSYCIEELYFWRNNLNSIKVRDCFPFNKPQRFAYSDASATGCGSSSTWRELAAIDFSLGSFAPILEVDCFANYYTAKLPRFFSRFWNPGTSGIDFFAQELSSENCLVVPPVSLVARVIHYLSLQKAMATLVVPLWPSSSFWPLLTSKYRLFMKGCFTLNASQALTLGRNLSSLLGCCLLYIRLPVVYGAFLGDLNHLLEQVAFRIYLQFLRVVISFLCRLFAMALFRSYFACLFCPREVAVVNFYSAFCRHCVPAAMVLFHAALKWFHSFVPDDGPNPLDDACCKNLIECAKRTRTNPEASLKDLRIAVISSLGFAGFFRFNELANIQPKHLTFCDGFVKIFVPRSKTDVYREGNYVYIAKLENKHCPVAILLRYIQAANLDLSSHLPLFRPLTKSKSGYTLRNGKLSYTRCREIFKTTLKDFRFFLAC
ncbi:unnamed protein product [Porites evermanni]|uniref:Uncharacterized protein n=1 Tax=Porites evermanni TaxID=104178 RepID=A0ABN8T4T3_9CNID|nr:unnamed protein product [Porites evermanni]